MEKNQQYNFNSLPYYLIFEQHIHKSYMGT